MITIIDSIMGSGKTSWAINELLNKDTIDKVLFITPFLEEIERIQNLSKRKIYAPQNHGSGKIGNIAQLLNSNLDVASTHALFRSFNNECKRALRDKEYTLILDEALNAVELYHFTGKEDYEYLLSKGDIKVEDNGLIKWVGSELDTRFDDVRTLAQNQCLFKANEKFFLWHFPNEIFSMFKDVYIMTYMFEGSIMKYYFDLYNIPYETKSITDVNGNYELVDYYLPDKKLFKSRISVYEGKLNTNFPSSTYTLSATWSKSVDHEKEREVLKKNLYNFSHNITKSHSNEVIWTCYKDCKKKLSGKGYTKGFLACNSRATNSFKDATTLMYCVNWYENPGIINFFAQHGISVDIDKIALANMLQWIWRSNIRVKDSTETIKIYIPSERMRNLFITWLNS